LSEEHLLAHKQGCQIKISMKIQFVLKWQEKDQIVYLKARQKNFDSSHICFTVHEFPVITQKNYYIRVLRPSRSMIISTQFNAKLALLVSSDDVKFLKT